MALHGLARGAMRIVGFARARAATTGRPRTLALPPHDLGSAVAAPTPIDLLKKMGVNFEKIHRRHPSALRSNLANLLAVLIFLDANNINAKKVIDREPRIITAKPATFASNLEFLKTLPINVSKSIESSPSFLMLRVPTIQSKIAVWKDLGLKPEVMLRRHPNILHRSEDSIRKCLRVLKEAGLDPVRIINAQPPVVSLDIERNLRPTIECITLVMGHSLQEINRNPVCLMCSLEKRLKPRHRYMKLHGMGKGYGLGTICTPTDERFVSLVADQPVHHYHQYLESLSL